MKYPCDRLAAYLARQLSFGDAERVRVDPAALYVDVTDALARRFAYKLLHYAAYAARMSREEAAERYWDAVLARRLLLTGRVELSVSHRLLEALCGRGIQREWMYIRLTRDTATGSDVLPVQGPSVTISDCAQRLARIPDGISAGSASASIRARRGPVMLHFEQHSLAVPEEMSIWDAISCGPRELRALSAGESFNLFCSVVIDCMRTAHRPFMELVRLGRGLCPFDWINVITIGQARHLVRFLSAVEGSDTPASWQRAWAQTGVPGFESADALWQSEIGLALRHALICVPLVGEAQAPAVDESPEGTDAVMLSEEAFVRQLELLEADRRIDQDERRLLLALYRGADRPALLSLPGLRARLRLRRLTLDALLDDLERRIEAWGAVCESVPS